MEPLKHVYPGKCLPRNANFFMNSEQPDDVPEDEKITFSNYWIHNWMSEHGVSLRHPNKRFQIMQADHKERKFGLYVNTLLKVLELIHLC